MEKIKRGQSAFGGASDGWEVNPIAVKTNNDAIQSPMPVTREPSVISGYMPAAPGQPGYNQMIAIGQASPHLPFKDWLARGFLSAVGKFFAWPFKMVGEIISAIMMALVGIVKTILILILVPSALIIGIKIAALQQEEDGIRGSAAAAMEGVMEAGRGAVNGKEDPPVDE